MRLLAAALFMLACVPGRAQDQPLPADAGLVNVKSAPYNAVGDGVADDTGPIQAAISYALNTGNRYGGAHPVYFPRGTYRVTSTLLSRVGTGGFSDGWRAGMRLIGESETGSVIRLADNAPGYDDAAAPKAVIKTGSEDPHSDGGGNQAFFHSLANLTVDTGSGNPGALGLDYLASNRGAIEHVTVRSGDGAGVAGIAMLRDWPGPSLVKNVHVEGFDYGVWVGVFDYGVTFEYLYLKNQRKAGLRNEHNALHVRKLFSQNAVPAVDAAGSNGQVVLIDAELTGGASDQPAIVNRGFMLARNVTSTGYGRLLDNFAGTGQGVAAASVGEFTSHPAKSGFASPATTLNLPIEETPEYGNADLTQWANVTTYGATPDNDADDDAPAIQAALDSGLPVVYLPSGTYHVGAPLLLRNAALRKVVGLCAQIDPRFAGPALVRYTGGGPAGVILDNLWLNGAIEHASAQPLALTHLNHEGYQGGAGAGKLFVEDVIGQPYRIEAGQRVWARQLNAEFGSTPFIENYGGTLWLLGFKTEGEMTTLKTVGGSTELLGGLIYPLAYDSAYPAFVNDGGRVSLSFTKAGPFNYPVYVRETRGGVTRDFRDADTGGRNVVLYTGFDAAPLAPLPVVLSRFEARRAGPSTAELTWATATEGNNAGFEVEAGADGQSFAKLVAVAGAPGGSSSAPRSYRYQELNVAAAGLRYYRLRQVDLAGGGSTYSPVQVVDFAPALAGRAPGSGGDGLAAAVFPNPAGAGGARLRAVVPAAGPARVRVLDALGRVRGQAGWAAAAGANEWALPLVGLAPGLYLVELSLGGQTRRLPLVQE